VVYQQPVKGDPFRAMDAVVRVLRDLPADEFGGERARLVAIAAEIPGHRDAAGRLARGELARPSGDALGLHAAYLGVEADPRAALEATLEGMAAQADPRLRQEIRAQFLRWYPELEEELRTALGGKDA
jgi:hypothetical protein